METNAIRQYLKLYPDDRLAALLAHAEDGKLAFMSCCCLVGALTADHALRGSDMYYWTESHYARAKAQYKGLADLAELQYARLINNTGGSREQRDVLRRHLLIPLIREEMARREAERTPLVEQAEEVTM